MTVTARSLMNTKAVTEDGHFPVREIFFVPETWQIRHVILDVGGWFSSDEILVAIDRFGQPGPDGWSLSMTGAELQDAPVLDQASTSATDLPPLVVGPFGNTFSPLLMAAIGVPRNRGVNLQDAMRDGSGRVFRMERLGDWLGKDAFGPDGISGPIEDFAMTAEFRMTDAILESGKAIRLTRFRRLADQGHALFD